MNLVERRVFLADENRWVRLKMSTRMLRTLNKMGVKSLIKKYGQDTAVLGKKAVKPAPAAKTA